MSILNFIKKIGNCKTSFKIFLCLEDRIYEVEKIEFENKHILLVGKKKKENAF